MTTRRRGRSTSPRTPRRKLDWITAVVGPQSVAPGQETLSDLTSGFPITDFERSRLTVMRMVGTLRVNSTDANLSVDWAAGFTMMNEDQVNSLVLPDPATDDVQWLWWDARSSLPASDGSQQLTIDSKSRRRYNTKETRFTFIMQNTDGVQSLEFRLGIRILHAL